MNKLNIPVCASTILLDNEAKLQGVQRNMMKLFESRL